MPITSSGERGARVGSQSPNDKDRAPLKWTAGAERTEGEGYHAFFQRFPTRIATL